MEFKCVTERSLTVLHTSRLLDRLGNSLQRLRGAKVYLAVKLSLQQLHFLTFFHLWNYRVLGHAS